MPRQPRRTVQWASAQETKVASARNYTHDAEQEKWNPRNAVAIPASSNGLSAEDECRQANDGCDDHSSDVKRTPTRLWRANRRQRRNDEISGHHRGGDVHDLPFLAKRQDE